MWKGNLKSFQLNASFQTAARGGVTRKVLSTLLHIHDFTDASDWSEWLQRIPLVGTEHGLHSVCK